MISFKQFLAEDMGDWRKPIEEVVAILKKDCSKFLEASGGKMIYRGFKISTSDGYVKPVSVNNIEGILYKGAVRADRKPKDSPKWLHDAMNEKFVSEVGLPLRSASLFVIGKQSQAEKYGKAYLIFPIGDFHYAWSPKLTDPTHEFYLNPLEHGSIVDSSSSPYMKQVEKAFFKYLKQNHKNVYEEVGENFSKFHGWLTNNGEQNDVDNSIWVAFVRDYIKENDLWKFDEGLQTALSPKYVDYEIMLACDTYYAVDTTKIATTTLQKFIKQ